MAAYVNPKVAHLPEYAHLLPNAGRDDDRPTATPPAEQGRRLATFDRKGLGDERAELRVSIDEYQGHPYISVRVWTYDARVDGWWPSRKGVSVRLSEAEGVAAALTEAIERVGDQPDRSRSKPLDRGEQGGPPARRDEQRQPSQTQSRPAAPARGPAFDEF